MITMEMLIENSLKGKNAIVEYLDTQVYLRFDNSDNMFWKFFKDETSFYGKETVKYRNVGENLISISWTEKSGVSVNKLIDLNDFTVTAVWNSINKKQTRTAIARIEMFS